MLPSKLVGWLEVGSISGFERDVKMERVHILHSIIEGHGVDKLFCFTAPA